MLKHKHKYSISQSAKTLNVTRQGFYAWLNRPTSKCKLRHAFLTKEIKRVYKKHNGNYGSPRIAQQLYDEGIETNKRVVAILMQRENLIAKGYHKRSATYGNTESIENIVKENLLNREFTQTIINRIWVTDITYVSCKDGRLYLSTYIDLTTRIPRC